MSARRVAAGDSGGAARLSGADRHGLGRWPIGIAVLGILVAATYHHTLDVPFYLDDFSSILENGVIYEWQGFQALQRFAPMRVVCYASFALNHRFGHFDPSGYHLINILIHFLAGLSVYGLVRGLLRTPRLLGTLPPFAVAGWPLLAAALFVVHPLQTQAVTYIVQRLASLVAMFYLAALAFYVQARLAPSPSGRAIWAGACLLAGILALFTKENSATLPIALVLVEVVFFRHGRRTVPILALLGLAGLALVWLSAVIAFGGRSFSLRSLGELTSQSSVLSRDRYLATQLPILWDYLRLFFWPVGLHLDHAPGPLRQFGDGTVWAALAGHLAVIAVAIRAWRPWPIVTFGLLFYYLAHAVESGIIPIPELAFEHRNYLPDLGPCLLVAWLLVVVLPPRIGGSRAAISLAGCVLLVLGVLTWQRNQAWRDPVAFWRSNTELAPGRARAWGNLGKHLVAAGSPAAGAEALRESMRLPDEGEGAATRLALDAVNLAAALRQLGRGEESLALLDRFDSGPLEPIASAMIHLSRGNVHFDQRRLSEAETSFRMALTFMPRSLPARANLASTLAQTGRPAEAEALFIAVLASNPKDPVVRRNLLQARLGRLLGEAEAARTMTPELAQRAADAAIRAWEDLDRQFPGDSASRPTLEAIRRALSPAEKR